MPNSEGSPAEEDYVPASEQAARNKNTSFGLYHDVPDSVRMTIRTPQLAAATTPTIIGTLFTHYAHRLAALAKRDKTADRDSHHSKRSLLGRRKHRRAAADGATSATSQNKVAAGHPDGDQSAPRYTVAEENPSLIDLSYDEGIRVIRAFLAFARKHTLEDLQSFTATRIPAPVYVRKRIVIVPYENCIDKAERLLEKQLQSYGVIGMERVGGLNWWKVRGRELEGEWIEMKRDYVKRQAAQSSNAVDKNVMHRSERVMVRELTDDVVSAKIALQLYIHGGAYFFSSLDTHRYQIQRHARKLGGRAFATSYRLAPQYPFPCGLLDCLASYLYLTDPPAGAPHKAVHPSCLVLAGDSAGGGMIIALLVMLRDLGFQQPAGAVLLSPWVDLTHSFPSIMQNGKTDYIPADGFHYRPSLAWPPVSGTVLEVENVKGEEPIHVHEQIQLYCPNVLLTHPLVSPVNLGSLGGLCPLLIQSGGGELLRDEQIYLAHKAAAPTKYPPSATVLADYPEEADILNKYPPTQVQLQVFDGCAHVIPTLSITVPAKYMYRSAANFGIWAITVAQHKRQIDDAKSVQRQHIGSHDKSSLTKTSTQSRPQKPSDVGNIRSRNATLDSEKSVLYDSPLASGSTTPATSVPSATTSSTGGLTERLHRLANEQPICDADVQSEGTNSPADDVSDESSSSNPDDQTDEGNTVSNKAISSNRGIKTQQNRVTVQGHVPSFGPGKIIRQRVSCHGYIREMEPEAQVPALQVSPDNVGRVRITGPIRGWLTTRDKMEAKYAHDLQKYRKIKADDYELAKKHGFLTRTLHNDNPPICSLASWYDPNLARAAGRSVDEQGTRSSAAMMMYMKMSSRKDAEMVGHYQDTSQEAVDSELVRMTTRQEHHEAVIPPKPKQSLDP